MVGTAEEVLATAETREEQGAGRGDRRTAEQRVEILGRSTRVAQMELYDHPRTQQRADREASALPIDAEHVADEEVAVPIRLLLAHHEAEEERVAEQCAVALGGMLVEMGQDGRGTAAVDLVQQVAVGAGDEHRVADRAASLRE